LGDNIQVEGKGRVVTVFK